MGKFDAASTVPEDNTQILEKWLDNFAKLFMEKYIQIVPLVGKTRSDNEKHLDQVKLVLDQVIGSVPEKLTGSKLISSDLANALSKWDISDSGKVEKLTGQIIKHSKLLAELRDTVCCNDFLELPEIVASVVKTINDCTDVLETTEDDLVGRLKKLLDKVDRLSADNRRLTDELRGLQEDRYAGDDYNDEGPTDQQLHFSAAGSHRDQVPSHEFWNTFVGDYREQNPVASRLRSQSRIQVNNEVWSGHRESDNSNRLNGYQINPLFLAHALPPLRSFSGTPKENFSEFLNSFETRFPPAQFGCRELCTLLSEHLSGPAKNYWMTLDHIRRWSSYDFVVAELRSKFQRQDRVTSFSAFEQMRQLKYCPSEGLADFCANLDELCDKALPNLSSDAKSPIKAELLYNQFKDEPDAFHLLSVIETEEESKVYDELKKAVYRLERKIEGQKCRNSGSPSGRRFGRRNTFTPDMNVNPQPWFSTIECNFCHNSGHIKRNCPEFHSQNKSQPDARFGNASRIQADSWRNGSTSYSEDDNVGQVGQVDSRLVSNTMTKTQEISCCEEKDDFGPASSPSILLGRVSQEYSSSSVRLCADEVADRKGFLGKKMVTAVSIFDSNYDALVDTGSQISIVSIKVLKNAMDKEVNMDGLQEVSLPAGMKNTILNASGEPMEFFGAGILPITLKKNKVTVEAPVYFTKSDQEMVLLGTNVLNRFGFELSISMPKDSAERSSYGQKKNPVCSGYVSSVSVDRGSEVRNYKKKCRPRKSDASIGSRGPYHSVSGRGFTCKRFGQNFSGRQGSRFGFGCSGRVRSGSDSGCCFFGLHEARSYPPSRCPAPNHQLVCHGGCQRRDAAYRRREDVAHSSRRHN